MTDAKYLLTDSGHDRIQKFDSQGHFLTKWGEIGYGDGQFLGPLGIAVDRQANVYVTDSFWVQKFRQNQERSQV